MRVMRPLKGVKDLRTHSGKVTAKFAPYLMYMQITCLEMEKARRSKERASAVARVAAIDARFRDIETEKSELLRGLGELNHQLDNVGRRLRPSERTARGFKFGY